MRINYLDSLRGIAAMTVVIYHANLWLDFMKDPLIQSPIPRHVLNIFFNGNNAVCLFFVLSGFVLSLKYIKINKTEGSYQKNDTKLHLLEFLIKRIFRLYPAMWAILLAVYLVFGGNMLIFLKEATLFMSSGDAVHKIPIDWTLMIEAQISIFIPIFIIVLRYNYRYLIYLAGILLCFSSIYTYVFHFIVGIFVAYNFHKFTPENWQNSKLYAYRYWLYVLAFVLCSFDQFYFIATNTINFQEASTKLGFILKGIGCAMIIILVLCSPKAQKFLQNPILIFLGNISYGIYVGHWFICIDIIETYYFPIFEKAIGSFYLTHIIVRYGLWTFASILIATILYYGVEKPFINLGNKLITKLRTYKYWQYL